MKEKKPYIVYIQEHYHRSVVVWAENKEQAACAADSLCDCGEVELERSCYAGRDVDVQGVAEESSLSMFDQYSE